MAEIKIDRMDGVTVITLPGITVEGPEAITRLDSLLEGLLAGGDNIKVVVDLSGVYRLTNIGLGLLLNCVTSLRTSGNGDLKVAEVPLVLGSMFNAMSAIFTSYRTVEEAVASFAKKE